MKKEMTKKDFMEERIEQIHQVSLMSTEVGEIVLPKCLLEVLTGREMSSLEDYMDGQTGPIVGGICFWYTSDVERFMRKLPVND